MKFCVTVSRDTREVAEIKIEAVDETAAKAAAEELVLNGDEEECAGIVWHPGDIVEVQITDVIEVKPAAA